MHHKSSIIDKILRLPKAIIYCVFLLLIVSILTLYSAAGGDFAQWAAKQGVSALIGVLLMLLIGILDARHIYNNSYLFYFLAISLLCVADIIGYTAMGAQRWLKIGSLSIQPSELIKPCLIIALARYYHDAHSNVIPKVKIQIIPLVLIIIPALLVLRQPNLGTATILFTIGGMVMLLAGVMAWKFILVGISMLISLPLGWNFLHDYQKRRVLTFLNPDQDPLGAGYNIIQSKIAIGSGGFSGKGFMQGSQSQLSFLPEKQTDFIFTVIAEEYGLIGSVIILSLYIAITIYGTKLALQSKQQFMRLIISSAVFMLTLHVFINIAMISGVIPAVGIPLPFLSYGGSNLIAMCISMGLILNAVVHEKSSLR